MLALIPVMLLAAIICGAFYYWLRQAGLGAEESANPDDRRRVALLTEITGYIGAVLAIAGGGVAAGQAWATLSDSDHVAVFGGYALFFLLIGAMVCWVTEAAIQRMVGVLWLMSAAGLSTAIGIVVHDMYGAAGAQTAVAVGMSLTVYSTALWLIRRREPQMLALFAGLTITVPAGVSTIAGGSVPWLAVALGLWALGIGWVVVGCRYPQPLWTTVPLGTMIALIGPAFAVWGHGWVFALAIATAATAMAVSIPARNTLLLTAGTLAIFGYIAAAIVRYFHASLGLPASFAACGVLLIAFALVMAWVRRTPELRQMGRDTTLPGHQAQGRHSRLVWPPPEADLPADADLRVAGRPHGSRSAEMSPSEVARTAVPGADSRKTVAGHDRAEPAELGTLELPKAS